MHVAYVIDNLGSGGAQRQAVEVAVRLRHEGGARVSFGVYREVDFFRSRLEEAEIPVTLLKKRGPVDPGFPARLRGWVAQRSPDVVHAFLPMPTLWTALAMRGAGGATPAWIAGERSSPHENVGRLTARLLGAAYRRFDAVTANSRPAAEALVRGFGVAPDRVHHLPNGIDLAAWDGRALADPPVALAPDAFHLALVGRLSEEKNHRLFLAALSRVAPELRRPVEVWFVGAEDGAEDLRGEIERLGLREQVRTLPPTRELPAFLSRLDALVLPSRYEGFPNVVLEAMASRLPVVASAVGDVPSLLEDGRSGFVVPAGDVAALAQGLTRLLALPDEARRRMGAAARETVEARFRIESVAQRHLDLYHRVADEKAGRRADGPLG